MAKANPVVHFELPADDRVRMSEFYTSAFGWETKMLGPEMGNYIIAMTTESDENGPKNPGAINGGFYTKTDEMPAQYPSVVISVDDIKQSMKAVPRLAARCWASTWKSRALDCTLRSSTPKATV